MYLKRSIDNTLFDWKTDNYKKPLLLRGARQVGKTKSIREFAKSFKYFLEINFEENPDICKIFEKDLSPKRICEELSIFFSTPIIENETLLFFDEIQQCIPAIKSLRFFYEKKQALHVIAAGSLLEFAIEQISSFGVGRIRSIYMYPLSFDEFLKANNEQKLLDLKKKSSPEKPISKLLHEKLLNYLKTFIVLGGMPEVVANYIINKDFNKCRLILDDLLFSFQDDFAKYKNNVPVSRLREVFDSVIMQTGSKFIYSKAAKHVNHTQIKEALNLLILSGLVIPVTHSSANGLPLGAETNPKKQKMLIFDTGILLRILDLAIEEIFFTNDFDTINKGNIAELFTGLELIKYHSSYKKVNLYYWHREAKSSNAEIDYLISKKRKIYPIEVKSGKKGSMQSMYIFLKEKKNEKGIRVSLENFSKYEKIDVYPLYAVSNILNS